MKKNISVIALISVLSVCSTGAAQSLQVDLAGIDISPALEFFNGRTTTLSEPKSMYSWSGDGARGDSKELRRVERGIEAYWSNYGKKKGDGIRMGVGLYTAADPVITRSYGGDQWLLTELNVPAGFRYLNIPKIGTIPENVKAILKSFDCSTDVDQLFNEGGGMVGPKCHQLVQTIFQKELKIDAIAYYYGSATFSECPKDLLSRFAWVILGNQWLSHGTVNYYTAHSKHSPLRRQLIQTLFKKAAAYFYHIEKLVSDPKTRDAYIELITLSEAQAQSAAQEVLWSDVTSLTSDEVAGEWIKKNLIGCDQDFTNK